MTVTKEQEKNGETTYHVTCDKLALGCGLSFGIVAGVSTRNVLAPFIGGNPIKAIAAGALSLATGYCVGSGMYELITEARVKKREENNGTVG